MEGLVLSSRGTDVVAFVVDEIRIWDVTTRATHAAHHMRKLPVKYLLAPKGCFRNLPGIQSPAFFQLRVRQELEFVHIGDHPVHDHRIGLWPIELVHDDVADEFPERGETPVSAIWGREANAPQIGRVQWIVQAVVGVPCEEAVRHVHPALFPGKSRDEEFGIRHSLVVASVATYSEATRWLAENLRTVESHVSQGDEKGFRLVYSALRHAENLSWTRELLVDIGAGRQAPRHFR